jgi:putative amino-acid transport system permease protein
MNFSLEYMLSLFPELLKYLPVVLFIAVAAFVLAVIAGLIMGLIVQMRVNVLHPLTVVIISYFRGTPALVQIFIFYFGLPQLIPALSKIDAITAVILAISIRNAAYLAEVFRSALMSVDKGQMEAALSVRMTRAQAMRRIILPQAVRIAIPPSGNYFIMIIKDTSLAFTIGVTDMFAQAKLEAAATYNFFEAYLAVGLIYWAVTAVLTYLQSLLERKVNRPYTA